jgi:hypothetical protein
MQATADVVAAVSMLGELLVIAAWLENRALGQMLKVVRAQNGCQEGNLLITSAVMPSL